METPRAESVLKQASSVGITSLALGLCFNYFFYAKAPGISFPLYIGLVLLGLWVIAANAHRPLNKETFWLLMPLLFFSAMVSMRSSALLTFLNIIASVALLLLIAELSFAGRVRNFSVGDYIKTLFLPFKFIRPLFRTLSDMVASRGDGEERTMLRQIAKGIVLALPLLFIFLLLFASADLIFQKYLRYFIDIGPQTFIRLLIVTIATLAFIGAYSYIFLKRDKISLPQESALHSGLGRIEISVLLGLVNLLFFTFILVQLAYLFGGENNISAQGFTYAEYARRGFFELMTVAVISFVLLWTLENYEVRGDERGKVFAVTAGALTLQVMVIMFSAFTRLRLYEEAFGFTALRLYSHAFIILLAVIFLLLLNKIFLDRRERAFALYSFISIVLFLAAMNMLNPDAWIVRRNIERFQKTGKLDVYYLSQLSDDAIPESIKVLDIENEDLKKTFARELYRRAQQKARAPHISGWQSLNLSRIKAEGVLASRTAELREHEDYVEEGFDATLH